MHVTYWIYKITWGESPSLLSSPIQNVCLLFQNFSYMDHVPLLSSLFLNIQTSELATSSNGFSIPMSFHLFLYYCVNDFSLQSHLRKPSLLSLLSSNTRHSAPCPGPPVFWEFPIESQLLVTVMCKRMQCAMACAEQFPFTVPFNSGITPLGRLLSLPFAKEETEKECGTPRSAELIVEEFTFQPLSDCHKPAPPLCYGTFLRTGTHVIFISLSFPLAQCVSHLRFLPNVTLLRCQLRKIPKLGQNPSGPHLWSPGCGRCTC